MRVQNGAAWLSYHPQAPVLPIGFSGTLRALYRVKKFKWPQLTMTIGELIPPLQIQPDRSRKISLDSYSEQIMTKLHEQIFPDDSVLKEKVNNERYELWISLLGKDGAPKTIPEDLKIHHSSALSKFLHRPVISKIFRSNLRLPTEVLEHLDSEYTPGTLASALIAILHYLDN